MKSKPRKKLPNKKIIKTPKFEAKEQFTNSALENLKSEKERLINNLIDSGEFKPNIWLMFFKSWTITCTGKEQESSGVVTSKYSVNNSDF